MTRKWPRPSWWSTVPGEAWLRLQCKYLVGSLIPEFVGRPAPEGKTTGTGFTGSGLRVIAPFCSTGRGSAEVQPRSQRIGEMEYPTSDMDVRKSGLQLFAAICTCGGGLRRGQGGRSVGGRFGNRRGWRVTRKVGLQVIAGVCTEGGQRRQSRRRGARLKGAGRQNETVTALTLGVGIGGRAEGGRHRGQHPKRGCLPGRSRIAVKRVHGVTVGSVGREHQSSMDWVKMVMAGLARRVSRPGSARFRPPETGPDNGGCHRRSA